jgi:hypothetical protein
MIRVNPAKIEYYEIIMGFTEESIIQPISQPKFSLSSIKTSSEIKAIFLTTTKIPDHHLWANGLFQNVFVLYTMFEAAGYQPFFFVDSVKNNPESDLHKSIRVTDMDTFMKAPFRLYAYIELGMSCAPNIRNAFRSIGAKVIKVYLGNILNIDIETPMFYPEMNFSHHVIGGLDEIWVSPHYWAHKSFSGRINGITSNAKICPYVWDSRFIQVNKDIYQHRMAPPYSFTVMEPNISFQKNSFFPIMMIEALFKKSPHLVQDCVVINGDKLKNNPFFAQNILPELEIFKAGKLHLLPRADVITVSKHLNNHILLQHTVNNEYNYSFLEHMYMGFPVVHNFSCFKEYGYYYENNNLDSAIAAIEDVITNHILRKEMYKTQSQELCWRFSPYNSENQKAWLKLIDDAVPLKIE